MRHRGAVQVDLRLRVARDGHDFTEPADFQRCRKIGRPAKQHQHIVCLDLLKTLQLHRYRVASRIEIGDPIRTVRAADSSPRGAGLLVRYGDGGSRNGSLTGVGHDTGETAKPFLCCGRAAGHDRQQDRNDAGSKTQSHVTYSLK